MKSAVFFSALIVSLVLSLSLYGETPAENKQNTAGDKTVSADGKNPADSQKDIRDTDIRDSEEKTPQKKTAKTTDAGAVKKAVKKSAKKKSAAKNKKNGETSGKKGSPLKKPESISVKKSEKASKEKPGEESSDSRLFSLRDLVINNRIFDVRAILDDPQRRAAYDLDRVITLEDGRKTTLLNDAVSLNYTDMSDMLLGAGADINSISPDSGAALHLAASADNTTMIRYLLQKGADVNVRDRQGNTPLMTALHSGHYESANLLVMKGADTASVNLAGSTTIIEAVTGGNRDCIGLILAQNRLDVNRADSRGETPLYIAMKKNDVVLMRLLRDSGASDRRVAVPDASFGELIEGTYTVKEYGRVTADTRRSADDTTAPFRYVFTRDGTGTVDMDDPALADMKFRWHVEGNALILEELDARGFIVNRLRFMFLQAGGTVIFEKSDVKYGDVTGRRLEITRSVQQ